MKFIVVSPRENPKSAGSMFLFQLAESIENLGYEANRILIAQNDQGHFLSVLIKKILFLFKLTHWSNFLIRLTQL